MVLGILALVILFIGQIINESIMTKCLVFFVAILIFSCSEYKGDKNNLDYDIVIITFDGNTGYNTNGILKLHVTDSNTVKKLNNLKNNSRIKWFSDPHGTEYSIRLVYENSKTREKLLVRILKNPGFSPTIEYGAGTIFDRRYKNNELVSYVTKLIKLDSIKKYKGQLSQKEYEKFFEKRNMLVK